MRYLPLLRNFKRGNLGQKFFLSFCELGRVLRDSSRFLTSPISRKVSKGNLFHKKTRFLKKSQEILSATGQIVTTIRKSRLRVNQKPQKRLLNLFRTKMIRFLLLNLLNSRNEPLITTNQPFPNTNQRLADINQPFPDINQLFANTNQAFSDINQSFANTNQPFPNINQSSANVGK